MYIAQLKKILKCKNCDYTTFTSKNSVQCLSCNKMIHDASFVDKRFKNHYTLLLLLFSVSLICIPSNVYADELSDAIDNYISIIDSASIILEEELMGYEMLTLSETSVSEAQSAEDAAMYEAADVAHEYLELKDILSPLIETETNTASIITIIIEWTNKLCQVEDTILDWQSINDELHDAVSNLRIEIESVELSISTWQETEQIEFARVLEIYELWYNEQYDEWHDESYEYWHDEWHDESYEYWHEEWHDESDNVADEWHDESYEYWHDEWGQAWFFEWHQPWYDEWYNSAHDELFYALHDALYDEWLDDEWCELWQADIYGELYDELPYRLCELSHEEALYDLIQLTSDFNLDNWSVENTLDFIESIEDEIPEYPATPSNTEAILITLVIVVQEWMDSDIAFMEAVLFGPTTESFIIETKEIESIETIVDKVITIEEPMVTIETIIETEIETVPKPRSICNDCTPPTLGVDNNGIRLVDNGFSYNGNTVQVDNYHTEFSLINATVGEINKVEIVVYENGGIHNMQSVQFGLGVKEIGTPLNNAEVLIDVELITDNTTTGIKTGEIIITDKNNLINNQSVNATASVVKCQDTDELENCTKVILVYSYRENTLNHIMLINITDKNRNTQNSYFNDGIQVLGQSQNPTPYYIMNNKHTAQQTENLTIVLYRTDKVNNIWTDGTGVEYHKASNDEFTRISLPEPYRCTDPLLDEINVPTRNNCNFRALLQ